MGYMEGNLSGMDYSYGGSASHYPLWKPPSGYFPRGEAPPPYEEAVAISQAEALSAQCTVSVATSTHRGVDLSGELRRNNQLHQQQQQQQQQVMPQHIQQQPIGQLTHQQPMQNHVGALPHHHHHQQQNQITQSTTNLINININSGGNVTTIATGENHQPPYSLQNDGNNQMLHPSQEHQLQQHHHQHQAVVSGRLHLPSNNSICVQTMSQHQQQQQLTVATMPNTNAAKIIQQQQQQHHQQQQQHHQQQQQHQQKQQQQQSHHQQQQQQTLCQALQVPECNYKNCQLNATAVSVAQRRMQRSTLPVHAQDMLQQYVTVSDVDLSSAAAAGCSITGSDFELIASPTQFSNSVGNNNIAAAISTPTIDVLSPLASGEISTITSTNAGHSTLPSPHSHTLQTKSSNNNAVGNKTPSSARRYHRTIPRYFAISDPLRTNGNETLTSTPAKCVSKSIATNTNAAATAATSTVAASTNANATSSATSATTTKKPTCQCPVQHVPMSYMGSNQLSMNAQQHVSNNVFISALNHKLNSSAASSSSGSNNSGRSSLSYGHRSRSTTSNAAQQSSNSEAIPTKRSTHNSPFCNHEPKIATISKQVGDSTAEIVTASHHHSQHHSHHHHNDGPLVVLSKVPKKSSQDRVKSAGRSENSAAIYLNGKVDAYLNYSNHHQLHSQATDSNPVLPPKLYKSLTNLKAPSQTTPYATSNTTINRSNQSSSVSATSSPQISHTSKASSTPASSSNYTSNELTPKAMSSLSSSPSGSGQTVYSIKSSDYPQIVSKSSTLRKDESKNIAPALTLPPPSPTNAIEPKSNKINSSTFYPLQNNHVTYTLPKHISGKISLNSTIANVVSKVPSVISIPTTDSYDSSLQEANIENSISTSNTAKSSKCTTLPKILRTKKDNHEPTTITAASVSQCSMPAYPQQYGADSTTNYRASGNGNSHINNNNNNSNSTVKDGLHLPVCTTSKNCLNPKEHFLPNDTSLDDDYLSECENCKIAQSSKYFLNAELIEPPQETMTLQRKSMDDSKEDQDQAYYRISHTLPTNPKKNTPIKNNKPEPWFSTIPASSSSEEDVNG